MSVVLVDWLGRGGIAQTTEAWAIELGAAGVAVTVVTRPDRELGSGVVQVVGAAPGAGRIGAHRAVARAAADAIRTTQPRAVVVQNYVLPLLEEPVYRAARDVGARVVMVVHDHRLHSVLAGARVGLRRQLQGADVVVAHTEFVAAAIRRFARRDSVDVFPLPVQVGVLAQPQPDGPVFPPVAGTRLAVHFGIVKRTYKGTDLVLDVATHGVEGWRFAVMGVGAVGSADVLVAPGFVSAGALRRAVEESAATLLPYRIASQSGAVVLSQALGSVPIASAVGGVTEQIADQETGLLLPLGASAGAWTDALRALDEPTRVAMAARARAHVWECHRRFSEAIVALCS